MINEVLSDTKMLLEITGNDKDELLTFYINDIEAAILARCRIEFLPRQLYGLIARIAAKMYAADNTSNITSVAEGDRKITYALNANDMIEEFSDRLAPFMNFAGKLPSEVTR